MIKIKPVAPLYIKQEMISCNYYFRFERRVLSPTVPLRGGMTKEEFKKYILLCRRAGCNNNILWSGWRDSQKHTGIRFSKRKEPYIIEGLIMKYYIEPYNLKKSQYKLLVAPRFNRRKNEFIKSSEMKRDPSSLKVDGNGYIMIPYEIVDKGHLAALSSRQLMVLIKLYEYNFLHIYGGIDPEVLRFNQPVTVADISISNKVIDRIFHDDIGITYKQFIITFRSLMRAGLVRIVPVVCGRYNNRLIYLSEYTKMMNLYKDQEIIWVARLAYQWKGQIEKWHDRSM